MTRPRALRTRLLLTVVVAVGVTLAAVVSAFILILGWELSRDATEVVRTRVEAELATVTVEDGRVVPAVDAGTGLETRAWVFEGPRLLRGPRVSEELDRAAAELAASGATGALDVPGQETRLTSLPIVVDGQRLGTVVAGVSLAPYTRIERRALIGSVALALAVLAAVALAASLILRAALRPVSRMTRDASAWSDRDLDMRFALGPPHDEITELAATLDGLLDRLAAGVRHERHLTAEISHELRTPLAQMRAEVDLALRRPREDEEYRRALRTIGDGVSRLSATIDTLLAAARQDAGQPRGTCAARAIAGDAVEASARLAGEHAVQVALGATADVQAGVSPEVAAQILQPVLENACRHAAHRVTIEVAPAPDGVAIEVVDDGPGLRADEVESVFASGRRGSTAGGHDGAGLGLALARRLARAAGGDVTADAGPGGRFTVRLPSA